MSVFKDRYLWLILLLLLMGVVVRILITADGNFIFHMDNARDMVDIREMVVLHKLRLIGPTSGIEGVFTGPSWYYLAAVPFILSSGDPYASILLQIVFWAIGGFFLLNLVKRWGWGVILIVSSIWIASDLVLLNSQHSLSPNPIIFLMPLFIFLLERFGKNPTQLNNLLVWLLAGLFFQLEMAFGIFMPAVIIVAWFGMKKKKWSFILSGMTVFVLTLLPQVVFDLRHSFLMTHALANYLQSPHGNNAGWWQRTVSLIGTYRSMYWGLMMNWNILAWGALLLIAGILARGWKKYAWGKDGLIRISLLVLIIPFLGYLILPIKVMAWHIQASMSVMLILLGYSLGRVGQLGRWGKWGGYGIALVVTIYSVYHLYTGFFNPLTPKNSPALFRNEQAAVDLVYTQAQGKGFKVYAYLPSVIDYPYQYLFWWRGLKQYGYLPQDYAYLPKQPEYISFKEQLTGSKNVESSDLVFLIKEPDTRGERHLWENSFANLEEMATFKIGSIEIEQRRGSL